MTSQGAAVGPITRYTPVIGDFSNATGLTIDVESNIEAQRIGDALHMHYIFRLDGTGTDAGTFGFLLGTWLSNNLSISIDYANSQMWAPASLSLRSTGGAPCIAGFNNSGILNWVSDNESGSSLDGDVMGGGTGKYEILTGNLILPITEWAGKGIVPMLAEDNLSQWHLSPLADSATIAGTSTTGSVAYSLREFRQRRIGDSIEVQGRFVMGTITTAPTGTLTFTKMFNETIDTSLQGSATIIGNARYLDGSASVPDYSGTVLLAASGSTLQVAFDGANDGAIPVTMAAGDQIYISFTVPITEWAGSQNSLVGYSEATSANLGLVKKNKWQVKILGSDKTSNGTFLTFNNLVVGKAYRIICQANILCEVDDTVGIQIVHDSNVLAETKHRLGPSSAGLAFGDMNSITMAEAIFVATATTATCDAFSIGSPSVINADGTRNLTWAMIEELNNYEAETTDFT